MEAKEKAICESDETDKLEEPITDFTSKSNPDDFTNKLYHVLSSSLDPGSRTISPILLRKSLINKFGTPFLHFPPEMQSTLKRDDLELVDTFVDLHKELRSVLLQCLDKDVRIAVWGAAINFILCLEQKDLVNFQDMLKEQKDLVNFQDMLTAMISTLKALYSGNEMMADAVNTFKLLINLAGMKPMFLRKQILEMVEKILLMADDLKKGPRRLAIEFVLTLVQFVFTLAKVEETNNTEEMWEEMWETNNYGSWRGCVDRLKFLSAWDNILTVALKVLPAYYAAPKGQKRHAELIVLVKSIITWNCRECLLKDGEWDVRVAALEATINFIPCPDLLTLMLSMLEDVLEDRDEAVASEVLELLIELVKPRLLVGQIMKWVKRMWQIVNNDSLNVGTRRLAIEFLLKLGQVEEIASWLQQNARKLFEILMNMFDYIIVDGPNAECEFAWESSNPWRWRTCLYMLSIAVGRNDMFSVVLKVLPAYLEAPEWQKKNSAFNVLAQSIACCPKAQVMIENLEQAVRMVLSPFPNAHRHVRCAAIKAIQQLLTHLLYFRLHEGVMRTKFEQVMSMLLSLFQDDDPVMQNASIRAIGKLASTLGELQVRCDLVLPTFAKVINDSPNQEMRARAASIILDFSKYCTRDNLREHFGIISSCLVVSKVMRTNFEQVMSMLFNLFQDDDPVKQNASIHAIEVLDMDLAKHLQVGCHLVLPALAKVINDSPNQEMLARAASIILDFSKYCTEDNLREHLEGRIRSCLVVWKEVHKFETTIRLTGRNREIPPWHERLSEIKFAWDKLWRNDERDFYMEFLMYPVFDSTEAQLDPDDTRHYRFDILEKAMACHVLCICVDELGELLVPEIGQVVARLIPFLEWYHDPPLADALVPSPECYYAKAIRMAAASAMPKILNSARSVVESSDQEGLKQYFEELSDKVLNALDKATLAEADIDEEVCLKMLESSRKCKQVLL